MTTMEEISKLITDYVDYAESELVNSEAAYQSKDGFVSRSSVIHAKRRDMNVEISISVKCHHIAKREI